MIHEILPVGMLQCNCSIFGDEQSREAIVIDPGDNIDEILAILEKHALRVKTIVITHAHIDHIGAIAGVRRVFDVPVLLHPRDLPYYRDLSARAAQVYGIDFEQPEGPDAELADGQELRCGDLRFTVMHVPGHAPGLVAFNGHGVSFGGDLLFAGSIGRTDLPLGNAAEMNASLERYASELPGETVVYPGHGPRTTLERERRTNPFLTGAVRPLSR